MEDVTFKTLVGVKWQDRHFHVIGYGFKADGRTEIILFRRDFPEESQSDELTNLIEHQMKYLFDTDCLKEVDHGDYRYICDETVDLDLTWKQEE